MLGNRTRPELGAQVRLRLLLRAAGGVLGATVVMTAFVPALGVLIAVLFWTVLAALAAATAAPGVRWLAPRVRAWAGPWLSARVGPALAGWWAVWWRLRMARMTPTVRAVGPAQLERGPRALPAAAPAPTSVPGSRPW